MLLETDIQWTRWTWNPWWGCKHVSEGCHNCYADRFIEGRQGEDFNAVRRTSKTVWRKPYQATKILDAEFPGLKPHQIPIQKRLMFTASMSDIFIKEADGWRADFWKVVADNPKVVFQILTKRHGRIESCLPPDWGDPHSKKYSNVWLGVSCENQEWANRRLPVLASIPCGIKFVSFEPLLGPINLMDPALNGVTWRVNTYYDGAGIGFNHEFKMFPPFDWGIVGGESGNDTAGEGKRLYGFRECSWEWIETLVRQMKAMEVAPFVKQAGTHLAKLNGMSDRHGGDITNFPAHLQVRQFPI